MCEKLRPQHLTVTVNHSNITMWRYPGGEYVASVAGGIVIQSATVDSIMCLHIAPNAYAVKFNGVMMHVDHDSLKLISEFVNVPIIKEE